MTKCQIKQKIERGLELVNSGNSYHGIEDTAKQNLRVEYRVPFCHKLTLKPNTYSTQQHSFHPSM